MKVIHYIPSIDQNTGGTATYIQLLAKELGKLIELHIFTHQSKSPLKMENCIVHYVPKYIPLLHIWTDTISTLFDNIQPDIVHINCCWIPDCAAIQRLALSKNYPVVITPHGMLEPWIITRHYWTRKWLALKLYQKAAIQNANAIISTSESEKNNLLKLRYNSKIEIIPNGIDIEEISLKTSWKKQKTILFLSRIHVKKGIHFLIEAIAALKNELQGYEIKIVGEGDANYIYELKQLASKLEVTNMIHFIEGVYGKEKWKLFKQADLFILPTYSENFGIAIAEALACGTPVITTQGTPWKELESYQCGWWIPIGTTAIIEALKHFLQCTESDLEKMGRSGRKLIEEKYSSKNMAINMIEVYRKMQI